MQRSVDLFSRRKVSGRSESFNVRVKLSSSPPVVRIKFATCQTASRLQRISSVSRTSRDAGKVSVCVGLSDCPH